MKLLNEKFTNKRLDEIIKFIDNTASVVQKVWGWDTGRFIDWYWGNNYLKAESNKNWYSENCEIFLLNDQIVALLISEDGGKDFCILTKDKDIQLLGLVLNWLLKNKAEKRGGISFEVSDKEIWLSDHLRTRGFKETQNCCHEWEYDLTAILPSTNLPNGFTIKNLVDSDDKMIKEIADVIKDSFDPDESINQINRILKNISQNPKFMPELSICALNPSGKVVAYCRGTVNPETGICGIDPVCCHSDYRRLGLAKAVVNKCFIKQKELGGKFSYIGSAPIPEPSTFLYRSLKPKSYTTSSVWEY